MSSSFIVRSADKTDVFEYNQFIDALLAFVEKVLTEEYAFLEWSA